MMKKLKPLLISIPDPENMWLSKKIEDLEIISIQDFIYLVLKKERLKEIGDCKNEKDF